MRNTLMRLVLLSMLAFTVAGCSSSAGDSTKDADPAPVLSQGSYVDIYPEETKEVLNNPDMGLVYIDNLPVELADMGQSGMHEGFSHIALLSSWGELEPYEDEYDFSSVDHAIDYWASKGKRIIFRISTDVMLLSGFFKYTSEVPSYLFDKYGVCYEYRSMQGVDYRVPDYSNPVFLDRLEKFMTAFGERYRDNPYLEGVGLLGYGPWGEWHSGHSFKSFEERHQTLAKIIEIWDKAFASKKPLFLSATYEYDAAIQPNVTEPASYEDFKYYSAFDYAESLPMINFARNGIAGALKAYDSKLLMDAFNSGRRQPMYLELFGGYTMYNQIGGHAGYDVDSAHDEVLMYHGNYMTVMGWDMYDAPKLEQERPDLVYKMNMNLGYRFLLKHASYPQTAKPGSTIYFNHTWANTAVGRSPIDYNLKVTFEDAGGKEAFSYTDESFAPSGFTKNNLYAYATAIKLPENLENGQYAVKVSLVSADEKVKIKLGIVGNDGKDNYYIGKIAVDRDAAAVESIYESDADWMKDNTVAAGSSLVLSPDFAAGQAYEISFDYESKDANAVMSFQATSQIGGASSTKGQAVWQDVSLRKTPRTAIVKLDAYDDYKLTFAAEDGAAVFSNIRVRPLNAVFDVDFEKGNMEEIPLVFSEEAAMTTEAAEVLGGKNSLVVQAYNNTRTDVAATYPDAFRLQPNTNYTVVFDYTPLSDAAQGGYGIFEARSEAGGANATVGSTYFADLVENGRRQIVANFTTKGYDDYAIYWGANNAIKYAIDNVAVVENPGGIVISGESEFEVPQSKLPLEPLKMPVAIDFENGSIADSGMVPGLSLLGQLTDKKEYVVSGSYSAYGNNDGSIDWMHMLETDPRKIAFKPDTTYTLSFDFKTVRRSSNYGGFYVLARTAAGTYNDDRGFLNWNSFGEILGEPSADSYRIQVKPSGEGTVKLQFTTANKPDYFLVFGNNGGGAITFDNIAISEGAADYSGRKWSVPAKSAMRFPTYSFTENFEGKTFRRSMFDGGPGYTEEYGVITSEPSKVISGKNSIVGKTANKDWFEFARTNSAKAVLFDQADYTVRFKFKPIVQPDADGFYYFSLRSNKDNFMHDRYVRFKNRFDVVENTFGADNVKLTDNGQYVVAEIRFRTENTPGDYHLTWGIKGGGEIAIDDVMVSVNASPDEATYKTWEDVVGYTVK